MYAKVNFSRRLIFHTTHTHTKQLIANKQLCLQSFSVEMKITRWNITQFEVNENYKGKEHDIK